MFYLINKFKGCLFFVVINLFVKENKIKKIGYIGMFDLLVLGLLLVVIDEDIKLIFYIKYNNKVYIIII